MSDLPRWLWLAGPLAVYPLMIALIFAYPPAFMAMIRKEGPIEWMSVVALLIGVAFSLHMLLRYRHRFPTRRLVHWFAFTCACMIFLVGEEISWGQHLNLWHEHDLSEAWRKLNDQSETNLHNLSNALDQGLTNLFVFSVLIAYVVIPLLLRYRGQTMQPDHPGYWFWPTHVGQAAAWGVLLIPFPKRIYERLWDVDASTLWRHSELHEFYIALLMMLYVLSAWWRVRCWHDELRPPAPDAA